MGYVECKPMVAAENWIETGDQKGDLSQRPQTKSQTNRNKNTAVKVVTITACP